MKNYDVIIAGAGPVGLFLATELALAKCSVLVLEKAASADSPMKRLPFGIRGLSAPTIEALDRRGSLGELQLHKRMKTPHQAAASAPKQAGHFAGIPFFQADVDTARWTHRLPSSTPPSLISEMEELETILAKRAGELGVEVERDRAITAFTQSADGVSVQSGDRVFAAKWLVGCDGARSVVRKMGEFEFAGTEPEFTGYSIRADVDDPEKLGFGRHVTARGMYLQSQPGYLNLQDFDGGAFHDSKKPATLEHVQELLRHISGADVKLTALHLATTWTDRARQATQYRNGRVLLAGDAAHIHSPLGGQGLNLGLGDAMNLGWKLAATIHGKAPAGLLDTYQSERHPVGAQVLEWSRAQVTLMRTDAGARALNAVFRDLMSTRDGATYAAARVWGIFTRYDLGNGHPLLGGSVPNFEFSDGTKINELMRDGRGLLLDFEGDGALEALAEGRVTYVVGRADQGLNMTAVLIRPDGIVAWVADDEADTLSLRAALARWF